MVLQPLLQRLNESLGLPSYHDKSAASTPNEKETTAANTTPIKVSCNVIGKDFASMLLIGNSGGIVTPKSNTSKLPKKRKY